jgi:hypothetical protein
MSDAGYVIAGWVATGGVLGAYWLVLVRRTRHAERTFGEGSVAREDRSA